MPPAGPEAPRNPLACNKAQQSVHFILSYRVSNHIVANFAEQQLNQGPKTHYPTKLNLSTRRVAAQQGS